MPLCQPDRTPPCILASLTVQIPWEITPSPADPAMNTEVITNDNGTESEPLLVDVNFDNIQVVKTCTSSPSVCLCPTPMVVLLQQLRRRSQAKSWSFTRWTSDRFLALPGPA